MDRKQRCAIARRGQGGPATVGTHDRPVPFTSYCPHPLETNLREYRSNTISCIRVALVASQRSNVCHEGSAIDKTKLAELCDRQRKARNPNLLEIDAHGDARHGLDIPL
jgi:hypothetical protein